MGAQVLLADLRGGLPAHRRVVDTRQMRDMAIKKDLRAMYPSLLAAFKAFDVQQQGLVCFDDFESALQGAHLSLVIDGEDVERLWQSAHPDARGFISVGQLGEFLGL